MLNTVKIMIFAWLLFLPVCLHSQKYTIKEIDSILINENHRLNTNANYKEAILINEKMIQEAEKLNYSEGISKGYLYMGSLYATLGQYKESLEYLEMAKKIAKKVDDKYLLASILLENARNYEQLGFHKQAITTSKQTEKMAFSIKSKYNRESVLLYSYSALMSNYYALNLPDSAYYYLLKSYKLEMSAYNLSALTYHHLNYSKQKDSIKYYLERNQKVLDNQPELVFEKAIIENLWGDFYTLEKKYSQALEHYSKSIPYALKSQATSEIANSYKGMSNAYEGLGNIKESKEYLVKYSNYKDSIANNQKKIADNSVQMMLEEKEKTVTESRKQMIVGLLIIVALSFGLVFIIIKRYKTSQQKFNDKLMTEHKLLKKNEDESNRLKQLVNPAFNEVIQLAKNNSPEFPIRFKEVYPEFCKRLLHINPDLQATDLRFCALISLNFSTKDIAKYTFVSPRSVQSKKYRLRKKLNLDTEADIYLFMSNLMTGIMS